MLDELSVVIPVGPGEVAWRELLGDLRPLPPGAEVLIVGTENEPDNFSDEVSSDMLCPVHWLTSSAGRARQMNWGARTAKRQFLWFLHADSRIDSLGLKSLQYALHKQPDALHFFYLAFQQDGPNMMILNAWGANLRSRVLRLPFGDQGFCLSRHQFEWLGGFDETRSYGEDHAFVWQAHRRKVPVRLIDATIATSARKYEQCGWLRTTAYHLWKTAEQALPQLVRHAGSRFNR